MNASELRKITDEKNEIYPLVESTVKFIEIQMICEAKKGLYNIKYPIPEGFMDYGPAWDTYIALNKYGKRIVQILRQNNFKVKECLYHQYNNWLEISWE